MSREKILRVLIDTTFLFDQYELRGIGRTGKEIILRLIPLFLEENIEIHIASFETLERNLIKLGFSQFTIEEIAPKLAFTSFGKPELSGLRNLIRWQKTYKPLIEELKPDMFFAAHFERGLPSADLFRNTLTFLPKTVTICYDVIPLKTNNFSSKVGIQNFIKSKFYKAMWTGIKNADLVFTISNFSKDEILSIEGVNPDKLKVVYLGISDKFYKKNIELNYDEELANQIMEIYQLKNEPIEIEKSSPPKEIFKKYFFYDSGIESNKGIFELLNTFAKLKSLNNSKIPQYLVIVGADFTKGIGNSIIARTNKAEPVIKLAKKLGILENIITTAKISDKDLILILSKATFYINLSKYEGFGLGIAQAFAAKVPVIASNLSSYPEISQNATLLLDLSDLDKATSEIEKFIKSKKRIEESITKGIEVVKSYDWDKTASEYLAEILNLLN